MALAPASTETLALDERPRWVYKSNAIIRARFDWTAMVHRVVMMLISQLEREQTLFDHQYVYVQDLVRLTGRKGGNLYVEAAEVASTLLDQKLEIRRDDGSYSGYNLFSDAHYLAGQGCIAARFNPHMRDFLLQLKEQYTKYLLQQAMVLSSPYSIRFYEIIKMMEGIGWCDLSVDEIRLMFKLEDKYERWRDLKRYVIDAAQGELREKCDLYFSYTELRRGRTPIGIKLKIHRKQGEAQRTSRAPAKRKTRREASPPPPPAWQSGLFEERQDPFEAWLSDLDATEHQRVQEEAVARTVRGHPDTQVGSRTFNALLNATMRDMYREREREAA
jgi:hypothetical protein